MSNLSLEIESIDALPDAVKGYYEKSGDKFRLKVDGIEDTSGLKSALQKERERAREVDQWKKLGKSPDEIQAALSKLDEMDTDSQKKAGNFEALQKKLMDQFTEKESGWQKERSQLSEALRRLTVENTMSASLQKAGVTTEGIDVLPQVLVNRVKVEMVDGSPTIKVFQADGVTPMVGSKGDATIEDLIAHAVEKYPSLFSAQGKSGSGKPPNSSAGGAGGKTVTRSQFDTMSQSDRILFARGGGKVTDG